MFKITAVPSRLKASFEALALGTETCPRVSWSMGSELFSLESESCDCAVFPVFYERASLFLLKKYNFSPKIITFDPHPGFSCANCAQYLKEKYFKKAILVPVFHHVAHVARFAIEEGLRKKFIGLAFDGTGYGVDGRAWGSEFFVYEKNFSRKAHFEYLRLAGSDVAIREPWRQAMAIAYEIYGKDVFKARPLFLKKIPILKARLVFQMLEKKFNIAYACGAGRLFDAFCAALGIKSFIKQEAEAAIVLEREAKKFHGRALTYPFDIKDKKRELCVDFSTMFKDVFFKKLYSKFELQNQARNFHLTVASATARVCRILRQRHKINTVYASGGVFMNNILCFDLKKLLEEDGFRVIFAKRPYNTDLGISEGQVAALCMGNICA